MTDSQTPEPRTLRSSVRNPRRRPRQSDVDSIKTAPRRKRSKISEDTFISPRDEEDGDVHGTIEAAPVMNGDAHPPASGRGRGRPRKESASVLDPELPLTIRGKKSHVKRPTRGDGATVLVENYRYSVKLLPSTPKELRRANVEYRGSLGAAHHALAITRERAYIWDYISHTPVTNPRIFDIPFSVKPADHLPFGALVTTGSSSDLGVVLVSANTGSVVYYESIERAASLSLFQERQRSIEGSLGSLFSGETVTELVSADQAGFIVILSSGRLIQLTLRDAQGSARVFAQFLRATEPNKGGIFSSIKGMLAGGSWKKDVTAVHTRSLGPRGPIQALSLTERAELQIWDLDWSGQYNYNATIDFQELVVGEMKKLGAPEMEGQAVNMATLDFAILEKNAIGKEIKTAGAEMPINLVLLVRNGMVDNCGYVLIELSIVASVASIGRVVALDTFRKRSESPMTIKPRLLLPKPQRTALVVFEDAVVVAELNEAVVEGPDTQLQASLQASEARTVPFEDTIYLKQDPPYQLIDAAEEDNRTDHASSIAFARGAGLVRISVADATDFDLSKTVPIKNRIEQAVFHGALQDNNIVDFARVGDGRYSPEAVEQAALEISDEILHSTSPFITTPPASIDIHLDRKAKAMRALVTHVRQNYPTLSKSAMWQLLWAAEKVAAGQQMWKVFENHKAVNSEKKQKRAATLVDEVCALALHDDSGGAEILSTEDVVRGFFIYRLAHIDRLLIHAYDVLKLTSTDTEPTPLAKIRLVFEADELWNKTLEAVFQFRAENAAAYGILPTFLDEGILTDAAEYVELPQFWTSSEVMLKAVVAMCNVSRQLMSEEYEKDEQDPEMGALIPEVGTQIPRLVELMCRIFQEHIDWVASRPDEKQKDKAERLRDYYKKSRYEQFRALADIAQIDSGLKLAEKYHDMDTLTHMIVAEMQFSMEELAKERGDQTAIVAHMNEMTDRIGKYFDRFGDAWANAYFDQILSGSSAGIMFRDAQEHWQESLTRYLRAEPSRAKLCWINDITASEDFLHAGETLLHAARDWESMIWAKKVELSMAKLALLAAQEGLDANGLSRTETDVAAAIPANDLELVHIQDRLYKHLHREIHMCIDQQAELEVAMQYVGHKNQDLHSLKQLLEAGLERVIEQVALPAEELIDVLTLLECTLTEGDPNNLDGQEFYLALSALNAVAPTLPPERVEMLLQLIWKRCYVYDDWVDINSTVKHSDEETMYRLKNTMAWRTLFHATDRNLFDRADSRVRHVLPRDCLGAGCAPQDLAYRWSDPDMLDSLVNDNRIQDEQLQGYVTDRRLDQWVEVCVNDVEQEVREGAEQKAQMLKAEREFADAMAREEREGWRKANGIKIEGDGEFDDDDEVGVGLDGDVEMG